MNQTLKVQGTVALGIFFAVTVFCCSFCQFFQPGAVYSAVPAQATFTYRADSLEELRSSPVYDLLDRALGAGNSMDALLQDSSWTRLAASSEIAVTAIPLRQAGRTKTWAAVSWVGWRSPWLRWKLEHTRAEGFTYLGKHAVWPVWQYVTPDIARGASLTFSLTDNLFIICLSENPTDIFLLLDAYDKRVPSHKDIN